MRIRKGQYVLLSLLDHAVNSDETLDLLLYGRVTKVDAEGITASWFTYPDSKTPIDDNVNGTRLSGQRFYGRRLSTKAPSLRFNSMSTDVAFEEIADLMPLVKLHQGVETTLEQGEL